MEIINRSNKGCEFIIGAIANTRIVSTIDNILECTRYHDNRTKERSYPKRISDKKQKEPCDIDKEDIAKDISYEFTFECSL